MTHYLHRYTFMRLVIPWIAGVFCGDWFFDGQGELLWSIVFFFLFLTLTVVSYFLQRHSLRWCFGVSLTILGFIGGWIGITSQLGQSHYEFPKDASVYRVLLTGKPEHKERSYLCPVTLKERKDSLNSYLIDKQAILYLPADSSVAQLKAGEELLVFTRLSPPKNSGNFDEFDYARYLTRKGISATGYVASGKWKPMPAVSYHSYNAATTPWQDIVSFCRTLAASSREEVLALYRNLGFAGDELAVLSALTIGDKTELSESIRESYSVSGASHVLALSGLHIGLLYALLFFALKPVTERWHIGRCLRSLLLILLLWSFACFTGLSSSVVRSVCMFSMLAVAELFRRQSFSLNTLAATAFLMLLCNPVWLFDVGFQLSFLAVTAILLLQQPIYCLIPVKTLFYKYVWGLMSVSIAAQIGTSPLILYYFSRFSTHFLLTNLVVIPLVTVILYSAVLMLFCTPVPVVQDILASVLRFLLKLLNGFTRWVEQLPYASIDGVWIYQIEVILIYACLFSVFYYFIVRRAKSLFLSLSCLLTLCTFHVAMRWNDRPHCSIVFYNIRHCPSVHLIASNGRSWLSCGEDSVIKQPLKRIASNFWKHHQLQEPMVVTSGYQDSDLSIRGSIIQFHHQCICLVTDDRWRNKKALSPLRIQYLYLCKSYRGHLEELTGLFRPVCIILDASLPEYQKHSLQEECRHSGIRNVSLSDEGSVQFLL